MVGLKENIEEWERERKVRIEKEKNQLKAWERLSRIERIKEVQKKGKEKIKKEKDNIREKGEKDIEREGEREKEAWKVWRKKETPETTPIQQHYHL